MAGFLCPACGARGSLRIMRSLELPPDGLFDEIALQLLECLTCRFLGVAVYAESRRGALDSESWDHTGYTISREAWRELDDLLARCPAPDRDDCACSAHRRLSQFDAAGYWRLGDFLTVRDRFTMELAR